MSALPVQQTSAPLLCLDKVAKSFVLNGRQVTAIRPLSLDIRRGEFLAIVGPSGCGKSTLLNMLAGLDTPDAGCITHQGQPLLGPNRDRLMMFQDAALFPWLDVLGNVLFGLRLLPDLARRERITRALKYLRMVGLGGKFRHAAVHELSGGMRQRVALARALAPDPEILLMDEPFAALDAMTREQLYTDLQRICAEAEKTVVLVTHNIREAVCLGDRVLLFGRPGEVTNQFSIDLPRPRDINSVNLARYSSEITRALKGESVAHLEHVAE